MSRPGKPFLKKNSIPLKGPHLQGTDRIKADGQKKNKEEASDPNKEWIPPLFDSIYCFNPLSL